MVFFNYALRKLNAKIVYYGPGLCGKTTNLQWIHDHFEGGQRGKMISLATEGDRTIFFDLLPIDIGSIRGMDVTLQLYTVPGQVHYNSTRQLVLRGADGVVFVADSQRTMKSSNSESFENLQENLMLQGIDLKDFPHVLQFNKRDLRDLLNTEELNESLNIFSAPIFEGIATEGIGVQETLEGIVKLVMRNLREKYEPVANAGGPQGPKPMQVTGPTAFQAEPPPAAQPDPPVDDFVSQIEVPPDVAPPIPPPSFEAPPAADPPGMDETQAVGPDAGFAAFENEDGIPTNVYEDAEEQIAQFEAASQEQDFPADEDTDAKPMGAEIPPDEERALPGDTDVEEEAAEIAASEPDPPVVEPEVDEPAAAPASMEDSSPEPEPGDDVMTPPSAEESMDDLFDAEPPSVKSYVEEVINAGTIGPDPGKAEEVAAPEPPDRFEDRIEAPGPFAPPPVESEEPAVVAAEPEAEPADSAEDDKLAQEALQEQMRQAFGASENREALASLSSSEPTPESEAEVESAPDDGLGGFLDEPPEVQPVTPPDDIAEPEPEVEEPAAVPSEEFHVDAPADKDEVFDQIVVEAPVAEEPVAEEAVEEPPQVPEPEVEAPIDEAPQPDEPVVSAGAFADDPITKAEPIMVGIGDPFSADDIDEVVTPEVMAQDAPMVPASNAIDVTAEGNQLNLKLKGSGAIAEMGQVRALDIEVPVPGEWVGNQKVTLQFRLTLTPAEDENE